MSTKAPGEILELFRDGYLSMAETIDALDAVEGYVSVELLNIERAISDDLREQNAKLREELRIARAQDDAPASPLRGRDAIIKQCALIAEGFDAACDSPRMKLFVDAGLVLAIYKRDGEIGAAIRALASASPPEQPAAAPEMFRCNCPHEVRSGCSEPQCPHYTPPRTEQPAAARDEAFTLKGSETENLAQQLIDATKRSGVDTYIATLLWRASSLIDRLSASAGTAPPEQPAAPPSERKTLWGQINAVYGDLDAKDGAWIDREWMLCRGIAAQPVSPLRGRDSERCPTCHHTDEEYAAGDWTCADPWHADDHFRAKVASPPEQPAAAPDKDSG